MFDSSRRQEWSQYQSLRATFPDAAERGRLMTAQKIASEPETRKMMEDQLGLDAMRAMYPEAYKGGFARFLEKVREASKW